MNKQTNYKQTEIGEIPEEWEVKQLQNVADFSNGYAFSSNSYVNSKDNAVPVLKMGNINIGGGLKITGKEDYASSIVADKLKNYLTRKNDILMCMTDMKSSMNLLGHSARIRNEKFLVNQRVGIIRPGSNVDESFLYYYLNTPKYIERLRTTARSGVQVNLTTEAIRESLVLYPPQLEQQQIASILSSLDEKIELNHKMNKTLEEMGKALFKHWFVDFEFPNEEGKQYKSSGGEMVDSELGKIPQEWKVSSLYSLADYINGRAFKTDNFSEYGLPIVKIAELKNGITESTKFANGTFESRYKLSNKDVLFSWSGSPDTSIDCFIWGFDSAWLNQHIFKIVPKKDYSTGFLYFLLKFFMPAFISIAKNKQTTGLGHVTVADLKRVKLALPLEITNINIFNVLFDEIYFNNRNSMFLNSIKDSLLPRLMSGKLRIYGNN